MTFLKAYVGEPKKTCSADILKQFMASDEDTAAVDCDALGNSPQNVYGALRQYTQRHAEPVTVTMENKQVVLRKTHEVIPDSDECGSEDDESDELSIMEKSQTDEPRRGPIGINFVSKKDCE